MSTDTIGRSKFRGTPLGAVDIAVLTTVSTILFTVYPELLWRADPDQSHFARFLVSYLAVVPLATLAVLWRHRGISKRDLTAAVIIVWSIKMIITVGMYHFMVAGDRKRPAPAPAQMIARTSHETPYAGSATFTERRLQGRVVDAAGNPVPGATLALAGLHEGKAFQPTEVRLTYTTDGFRPASLAAFRDSRVTVANESDTVVVLAGTVDGRTVFNVPVVPGTVRDAPVGSEGVLTIRPQTGPKHAVAHILVAPTPYTAVADSEGRFQIDHVPDSPCELWVLPPNSAQIEKTPITTKGAVEVEVTVAAESTGNS